MKRVKNQAPNRLGDNDLASSSSRPKRHILVAVSGTSTQIVTETLYKLMIGKDAVPVSEVHLLTTRKGAEMAWKALGGEDGAIARFVMEYRLSHPISFTQEHHIHVFKRIRKGGKGKRSVEDLDDIRTSEDNEMMASQMLGVVKELTQDPDTVLHCSIAGGRKTMGVYLMLALMLYGRKQDRLSHVLVRQEFETNRNFFFPPAKDQTIAVLVNGNPTTVSTGDASIDLAEIPFVRLRMVLGEGIAQVEENLSELIEIAQSRINRVELECLVIDLAKGQVWFGDQKLEIKGVALGLLAYYAIRKTEGRCLRPDLPDCSACQKECYQHYFDLDESELDSILNTGYRATKRHREAHARNIKNESNIRVNHKRTNDLIKRHGFVIDVDRGTGRYGISLDKTRIKFIT